MRINRAIGLGIALLVLQWLAGSVWVGIEQTLLVLFDTTQAALGAAEEGLLEAESFIPTVNLP